MVPSDVPPAPTPAQVAALRVGFDRAVRHDAESGRTFEIAPLPAELRFSTGEDPIHEALLADRQAFRDDPIPPLTDLYVAAGLVERDAIIAEDGLDWDALRTWQTRTRLGISYGLDSSQADDVAALVAAYDAWSAADGEPDTVGAAADPLDDGDVATALWSELRRRGATTEGLVRFARGIQPATDPSSIGAVWLRARVLERSGDTGAAVDALEAAIDAGCRHRPALVDLAGFRADRGDAVGALRLLIQAGIGPRGEMTTTTTATSAATPSCCGTRSRASPPIGRGRPPDATIGARADRAASTRRATSAARPTASTTGPDGCTSRRNGSCATVIRISWATWPR